jgi:hypothetical protein
MAVRGPDNITGTITAPPGSNVSNVRVTPMNYTNLKGTWTYYNSSSHAQGWITFGSEVVLNNQYNERNFPFVAFINGKLFAGTYQTDITSWLSLCHDTSGSMHVDYNSSSVVCADLTARTIPYNMSHFSNHIELTGTHYDTIYLTKVSA